MAFDFQSGLSDLGSAVGDFFGAAGASAGAKGYKQAAALAGNDADIAQAASNIRVAQTRRQTYKVISGQASDVGAAGFGASGSAGDLARDSAIQANMAVQGVQAQGEIQVGEFKSQQQMDLQQAAAAKAQASGDLFSGIMKLVGFGASLFGL